MINPNIAKPLILITALSQIAQGCTPRVVGEAINCQTGPKQTTETVRPFNDGDSVIARGTATTIIRNGDNLNLRVDDTGTTIKTVHGGTVVFHYTWSRLTPGVNYTGTLTSGEESIQDKLTITATCDSE